MGDIREVKCSRCLSTNNVYNGICWKCGAELDVCNNGMTDTYEVGSIPSNGIIKRFIMRFIRCVIIVLILVTVVFTVRYFLVGNVNKYKALTPEQLEKFKGECVNYTYDEIYRNPKKYSGYKYYTRGKVVQVQEDGVNNTILRVNVTFEPFEVLNGGIWNNTVFVETGCGNSGDGRLIEGDIVDIYGTLDGIKTYTALLGNEVQLPKVLSEEVGVVGHEDN